MNYQMLGDADAAVVEVALRAGEQIKIESGAMVYMQDVTLESKTNSNSSGIGGLLKAAARAVVSNESMFITFAKGNTDNARIGIAPGAPGSIMKLEVGANQYRLNDSAFFACDAGVEYQMKRQELGKAVFAGTGGLFVMETAGSGDLLVNAFGSIIELQVTPDRPLVVDNSNVVAWDASLAYQMRMASNGILSTLTSGEGIVNEFRGSGRVFVQSRSVESLASKLIPYLPKSSN